LGWRCDVTSGAWTALLLLLFVIALFMDRGLLAVFALILAVATGATTLWARYCLAKVAYRRYFGTRHLSFGEETTLTLEFENAKPLPLAWLLVREEFPDDVALLTGELQQNTPGDPATLVTLLALRWYERVSRTHRIQGIRRGRFQFGPAELSSGDVFGYQRQVVEDPHVDEILVYPKIVPVEALSLPVARPMGEWVASRRVTYDPLRFATVREYVPGDNPRHIHWRATARTTLLQVKEFDPSDTLALMMAIDVQTTARSYEYVPDDLEFVISAAASVALYALDEGHMVGMCANALTREANTWSRIAPGRHVNQANVLLSAMAALGPFRGQPLASMLCEIMPELPYGATVIAVTSQPNEAVYESLANLQDAGHRVLLLTVGREPIDMPSQIPHHHLGDRYVWQSLDSLELD
jgi:uncharacterized protein (DUF58 family)